MRHSVPLRRPRLTLLLLVVALVGISTLLQLLRGSAWLGWLPAAMSEFQRLDVWVSPVSASFAAWGASRQHNSGLQEWLATAARSRTERVRAHLAYCLLLPVGTYAFTLVSIVAINARYVVAAPAVTGNLVSGVLMTGASGLLWTAVGYSLGQRVRPAISVPVSAVLPYLTNFVLIWFFAQNGVGSLAVNSGDAYVYVVPDLTTGLSRLAVWGFAAAAVCLAVIGLSKAARASAVLASFALATVILGGPHYVPIPQAQDVLCQGSSPEVCIDRAHSSVLNTYQAAVTTLWRDVPAQYRTARVQPAEITRPDGGLDVGPGSPSGGVLLAGPVAGFYSPSFTIDHASFVAHFGTALFPGACLSVQIEGLSASVVLYVWWRIEHQLPATGQIYPGDLDVAMIADGARYVVAAQRLSDLTGSVRAEWFATNGTQLSRCVSGDIKIPTNA